MLPLWAEIVVGVGVLLAGFGVGFVVGVFSTAGTIAEMICPWR